MRFLCCYCLFSFFFFILFIFYSLSTWLEGKPTHKPTLQAILQKQAYTRVGIYYSQLRCWLKNIQPAEIDVYTCLLYFGRRTGLWYRKQINTLTPNLQSHDSTQFLQTLHIIPASNTGNFMSACKIYTKCRLCCLNSPLHTLAFCVCLCMGQGYLIEIGGVFKWRTKATWLQ